MSDMSKSNIILTGFMGTGKTAVGREVAAQLGRPFVDLDDLIVARAGKPIPRIFAENGEPAFRALEAALCQELAAPAGLVIATGGGAVLDPANREALAAGGILICLEADVATILARLEGADDRPLLATSNRRPRIVELLEQRAAAYAAVPHHLDTTGLSIAAAAERVLGIAAGLPEGGHRHLVTLSPCHPVTLSPAAGYDVLIADGLLAQAGRRLLTAGLEPGRCAVVTNPTVAAHYAGTMVASLEEAGFEPLVFEVPDGEAHKTLATAGELYGQFAEARLARGEPVIALGGGVIGDLAGFVAATWLRGVPFVQVPTSLLAMVDASVGGKVAVDLPQGKNLVGAFKQPALVLKAGLIGDPVLFEQLCGTGPASLVSMIAAAVRVKARIVERDPFELGDRAWLNLGHTFGHALELLSGFTLRHGEAVALGLIAATELSAALGYCDRALPGQVAAAVERLGLPTIYPFDPAAVLAAMATDKKRRGRVLRFVLPRRVGQVEVVEGISESAVLAALESIRQEATN
jgi:3-dehydroquinate synthetase/shikimate kinase